MLLIAKVIIHSEIFKAIVYQNHTVMSHFFPPFGLDEAICSEFKAIQALEDITKTWMLLCPYVPFEVNKCFLIIENKSFILVFYQ